MQSQDNNMTLLMTPIKYLNDDKYVEAFDLVTHILQEKANLTSFTDNEWQVIGDIYLTIGKFSEAANAYLLAQNICGEALALILDGKISEAKLKLKDETPSPARNWCYFLSEVLLNSLFITHWPSHLQIRHFMENTVYYLLVAKKDVYINKIFGKLDKLLQINQDSEKYIGYAYFHYGELDKSLDLLINSAKRNQYDGEIYFVLGQLYYAKHEYWDALSMLENAALFLPEHYPTKMLKEKILQKIKSV